MIDYNRRQIELVEFTARVYHSGLRHKGINGSLYEDKLINFLRRDIPELNFYKGQIRDNESSSPQYDIIICKNGFVQPDFLQGVNDFVNIVDKNDCLGVIELKKSGFPKMISEEGVIQQAYNSFKDKFPELNYFFVCLRFNDRVKKTENNWINLIDKLKTDGNFCFFGKSNDKDRECEFPWIQNTDLIEKHKNYLGQYQQLIMAIKKLTLKQ